MLAVSVFEADLSDAVHARAIAHLIDEYAREPMGGGRPLPPHVRRSVVGGLAEHPTSLVLLAQREADIVGVAVCFWGYSTFNARPLLNVHDLAVTRQMRGHGVGRQLLEDVEKRARARGCCKLTLEVRGDNRVAQGLYRSFGFRGRAGGAGDALGGLPDQTFFWEKPLA